MQLSFPNHVNGHFLGGCLEDLAKPILGGFNHPSTPPLPQPSTLPARPSLALSGHSQPSIKCFTQDNRVIPSHFETMPGFRYLPPSRDGSEASDSPTTDQVYLPYDQPGLIRAGYRAPYLTALLSRPYPDQVDPDIGNLATVPAGQVNFDFGNFSYPAAGNPTLNMSSDFNSYSNNNMMPRTAPDFGQPTSGHSTAANLGAQYYGAGNNFGGFANSQSYNQGYANTMPAFNPYVNMYAQQPAPAAPAGFLESGFTGDSMISLTTPPGTTYSFGPSNAPPFVDLTRFVWPSDKPVVKIANVSALLPTCHISSASAALVDCKRLSHVKAHLRQ